MTIEKEAQTANRRLAKVAVQCSADPPRRMVNQTLVPRINPARTGCFEIANFL